MKTLHLVLIGLISLFLLAASVVLTLVAVAGVNGAFSKPNTWCNKSACNTTGWLWYNNENTTLSLLTSGYFNSGSSKVMQYAGYDSQACDAIPPSYPCYTDPSYPSRILLWPLTWDYGLYGLPAVLCALGAIASTVFFFEMLYRWHKRHAEPGSLGHRLAGYALNGEIWLFFLGLGLTLGFTGIMFAGMVGVFDRHTMECQLTCTTIGMPTAHGIQPWQQRTLSTYIINKEWAELKPLSTEWLVEEVRACPRSAPCYKVGDALLHRKEPIYWYLFLLFLIIPGVALLVRALRKRGKAITGNVVKCCCLIEIPTTTESTTIAHTGGYEEIKGDDPRES